MYDRSACCSRDSTHARRDSQKERKELGELAVGATSDLSRMSVGVSPEGFRWQLHGGQADVREAERGAEELTEERQCLLHLPV